MSVRNVKQLRLPARFSEAFRSITELFAFFRQVRIVPFYFFLSVACSSIAVYFNLLGLRLLIPLLQGVIKADFASVSDKLGMVRVVRHFFPGLLRHSFAYFLFLLGVILISVLVKNTLDYVATLSVAREIRKADHNLRQWVIHRYLGFGKLHFDRMHAVTVTYFMQNAAAGVTGQLRSLHKLLSQVLSLVMYLGLMLWLSWPLTLFAVTIFPLMNLVSEWLVRQVEGASRAHEVMKNRLAERVMSVVSIIPLVKAYAAEAQEEKNLAASSEEEIGLEFQVQKKQLLVRPIQDLMTMAALLLMVASMMLVLPPTRDPARVSSTLVFFYIVRIAMPNFGAFLNFRMAVASAGTQVVYLREILLSDENKFIVPGGPKTFAGLNREIAVDRLNFAYRDGHPVLRGLSLRIPKGKVTAITGATGAGKTTLAHLFMRFYDCPPGTIFMDGEDIRDFSIPSLMDRFCLVSQDHLLMNTTLRANLVYGLKRAVSEEEVLEAAWKAKLGRLVEKLPEGLDTVIGDRGSQLSGGQRQRVAIARAFLKRADVLILDEATSALDSRTEQAIQESILAALEGRTAIVIAHRLSTIRNADKIVVIEEGRVAEEGNLEELLAAKGRFYQYWQAQGLTASLQPAFEAAGRGQA